MKQFQIKVFLIKIVVVVTNRKCNIIGVQASSHSFSNSTFVQTSWAPDYGGGGDMV